MFLKNIFNLFISDSRLKNSDIDDGNTSVLGDGGSKEMGGRYPTCPDGGSDMMAGGVSVDGDGDNMIPAGKKINHILLCRVQKGGGDKYQV